MMELCKYDVVSRQRFMHTAYVCGHLKLCVFGCTVYMPGFWTRILDRQLDRILSS